MNKIKLRRPPTAVLIAIIAVVVLAGTTVAWLTVGEAVTNRIYRLSNFDAYAEVYFDGAINPPESFRNADGSINISFNDIDENYIENLRVDAKYKGMGAFYLRLKMVQQWTDGAGKILQANTVIPYDIGGTPYNTAAGGDQDAWFDNRLDDYCLYYANKIQVANGAYTTTPIITGTRMIEFNAIKPTNGILRVAFTLEAVQVNRYPQFWGLESLPWLD